MSSSVGQRPDGLVKLSGTIRNYRATRASANSVFTNSDKTAFGVVAIAAGIAGLSGQGISTASSASAEEDADYVEFDLTNKPVKGWVWRNPFKDGDVVDVAAEWWSDHYEAGGVLRPADHTIALYPHCSRGRTRHIKNAMKLGGVFFLVFILLFEISGLALRGLDRSITLSSASPHLWSIVALGCFFSVMVFSMTRK